MIVHHSLSIKSKITFSLLKEKIKKSNQIFNAMKQKLRSKKRKYNK